MAGRRTGAGLALAAIALSSAGCGIGGSTKTVTVVRTHTVTVTRTVTVSNSAAACAASQLSATFASVPGSSAAGHVAYALTVTNTSNTPCSLGVQTVVLLDSRRSPLPTHAVGALPRGALEPSASTSATASFSPDVPGKGDSQSSRCQPEAWYLRVTPDGGGTLDAEITPPTSVCERGTLVFPSN